jgi:uncharacterized protein (DUF2147 family)
MPHNLLMFKFLVLFFLRTFCSTGAETPKADLVCGKWLSEKKDFLVLVYRDGNTFKGKTLWFKNKDTSKAMDEWTDKHNPDPTLRSRKVLGLNILTDLTYNPESGSWENGKIYDTSNGRFWSAYVRINKDGTLKVTAFWTFKFISRSVTFTRYNNERLVN